MEGKEKHPENDPEKSPWVRKSAQGYLLLGQALGSSQIRHIKPFQQYFLTIVDVYTRMTWVYVLPKKSDVAETVKTDWLPMVERQQDRLVKAIRTD
ncbi:hypothetical protein CLOM_g6674, partial [Closterium sp. NIES-68]